VCFLFDCCVRGLLTAVDLTLFAAFYIGIRLVSVGIVSLWPVAMRYVSGFPY
jgi:hypothetical protein